MRTVSRFTTALALLIPLAGASCSTESGPFAAQPVVATLTDKQAATLAYDYFKQNSLPATGTIIGEERKPNGWWFYYQTAFDAAARPPSLCYLIRVRDDGTVDQLP